MHALVSLLLVFLMVVGTPATYGQQLSQTPQDQSQATPVSAPAIRPNYVLGPNDQILIRIPEAEEINEKAFRVDAEGNVSLPLVGVIRAGGFTVEEFEDQLTTALKAYVRSPHVSVSVVQFRADPVFLVGAFQKPGIYGLQGQRTLVDLLSVAGGLQPNASHHLRVTRRLDQGRIPLPTAIEDPDTKVTFVEIGLNRLMETSNPAENIVLQPYDVVRAFKAEMVFLNMENGKGGAYPLDDRDSLSVTQLISLSGGLSGGDPANARVLRPILDSNRRAEIPINVKRILEGKANDFPLMPNDVLFIPKGGSKLGFLRPMLYVLPSIAVSTIFILIRNGRNY